MRPIDLSGSDPKNVIIAGTDQDKTAPLDDIERSKRLAAFQAVDNHVLPEHKVSNFRLLSCVVQLPLGHRNRVWCVLIRRIDPTFIHLWKGSTVPYVVERIVQQGAELNKLRVFIPTGMFQFPRDLLIILESFIRISIETADRRSRFEVGRC